MDATHTKARYNQKSPKEFLQEKSKNVRKAVYQVDESIKEKFPEKPISSEIEDELDYCNQIISIIEREPQIAEIPAVKEKLNVLKEVTEDFKENHRYSMIQMPEQDINLKTFRSLVSTPTLHE